MNDRLQAATGGQAGRSRGRFDRWIGGRANRRDYWLWVGPLIVLSIVLGAAGAAVLSVAVTVPILFVWIRRLHDLGRTGWWAPGINVVLNASAFALRFALPDGSGALLGLVVYLIAIVGLGVAPGQPRPNEFGLPSGKAKDIAETFS